MTSTNPTGEALPDKLVELAQRNAKRFWIVVHEPGLIPRIKGPYLDTGTKEMLRDFMQVYPTAYIDVLKINDRLAPEISHGPEMLQILDGRSMSVGRRHNKRTSAAHAIHHAAIAALRTPEPSGEPSWRSADTYELGQVIFNHLHGFLNAAGINGTDCKLTITVPTDADRKKLTKRLQSDMGDRGPPRSAGRVGNSAGTWQGIAYEFAARTIATPKPLKGDAEAMCQKLESYAHALNELRQGVTLEASKKLVNVTPALSAKAMSEAAAFIRSQSQVIEGLELQKLVLEQFAEAAQARIDELEAAPLSGEVG